MAATLPLILWGTNYENVLTFGYPLDSVITGRIPRAGSEHGQLGDGTEIGWIEGGYDFTLEADLRWMPDVPTTNPVASPWGGSTGVEAWLAYARSGQPFRYVPDATLPLFYVDNCYLVEPYEDPGSLETDATRDLHIKIRNPSVSFALAQRGIMFEYAAGADISALMGLGLTYTGPAERFLDITGLVQTAAANVLRDRHYDRLAQLVVDPENFGAWSVGGTGTRTAGQADPFGGTAAYLLNDTDAGSVYQLFQVVPFTGDAEKSIAIFVKQGTGTQTWFGIFDSTAALWRHQVRITWSGGVPSLVNIGGNGTRFTPEQYPNGWWRVKVSVVGVVAANTNNFYFSPADNAVGGVGTTYFFGANAWNLPTPLSYQNAASGRVAADSNRRIALFEESRTNLILSSEDLRTGGEGNPIAIWSATANTLTANSATAPDGALTADKLVETAVNSAHDRSQNITITAGRCVVLSGFFKPGERTQGNMFAFNGADFFAMYFDTVSGIITPSVGGTGAFKLGRLEPIGGGWWYVWASGTVSAGATAITVGWQLAKGGTTNYLGTLTEGAWYWGLQAEQINVLTGAGQNVPAFYIPTTTATVTRTQDLALKAWPWQKQPMWFYAKFVENGAANGGTPSGTLPDFVAIGQFGANLRTEMTGGAGGTYNFSHGNSVTTRIVGVTLTPAIGDEVELLGVVYDDDSVQLFGRKKGGPTVASTRSAAGVATPPYSYLNLQIGGEAGAAIGILALEALKVGAGQSVVALDAAAAA